MTLLAGAVSVYAQGYVNLQNYAGGYEGMQVFGPQAGPVTIVDGAYSGTETQGNTSNTYLGYYRGYQVILIPGTTVYTAAPLQGSGYSIALYGVAGTRFPQATTLCCPWPTTA